MDRASIVGLALTVMFGTAAIVVRRQLHEATAKSRWQATVAMYVCAGMGLFALGATVVAAIRG